MKYEVIEEVRLSEGKKEVWYLVEPKNKIIKALCKFSFILSVLFDGQYSPHVYKEDAIKKAKLKNAKKWDKKIMRRVVK